jgi:hypothetical protein
MARPWWVFLHEYPSFRGGFDVFTEPLTNYSAEAIEDFPIDLYRTSGILKAH